VGGSGGDGASALVSRNILTSFSCRGAKTAVGDGGPGRNVLKSFFETGEDTYAGTSFMSRGDQAGTSGTVRESDRFDGVGEGDVHRMVERDTIGD